MKEVLYKYYCCGLSLFLSKVAGIFACFVQLLVAVATSLFVLSLIPGQL